MIDVEQQRRLTNAFIDQYPVDIVLVPHGRSRTATGGFTDGPQTPRDAQTMTIVQTAGQGPNLPVFSEDGPQRSDYFQLIGRWSAEIELHDEFTVPGQTGRWKVTQMYFENGWERRAQVQKIG